MIRSLILVVVVADAVGGVGNCAAVVQADVGKPSGLSKGGVGRTWAGAQPLSMCCPCRPADAAPSTVLPAAVVAGPPAPARCRLQQGLMYSQMKRHAVQLLLGAGHTQAEVAELTGLSERTVRRINKEDAVAHLDDRAERVRRRVGRPSKTAPLWRLRGRASAARAALDVA